jgi:transposase
MSVMILALLESKSVNLARLCLTSQSNVLSDSMYKRMKRFIANSSFCPSQLISFIMNILNLDETITLILDRTNWKFGKTHINILYLAISYKGLGIPIVWTWLEDKKRGNSDHFDRIDLIETFMKMIDKTRIKVILGDREFIGFHWIHWLEENKIPYIFRLKENGQYISNAHGKMVMAHSLCLTLKAGESISFGKRKIGKTDPYETYVSGLRNHTGEIVMLLHSESIKEPCNVYRERWQIEVLFRLLKSGGFDLETTHVTHPERLDTLLSVLAIALIFSAMVGLHYEEHKKIPIKKHGFKEKSSTRVGLDCLIMLIRNTKEFLDLNKTLRLAFECVLAIAQKLPIPRISEGAKKIVP